MSGTNAKAGDQISEKARKKLLSAMGMDNHPSVDTSKWFTHVLPKSDTKDGQWFCIDCGDFPRNNLEAHSHAEKHSKRHPHRLAWRSSKNGEIEEP